MADDFDSTTATVREYHRLVASAVTSGSGTLANFVGDNFMAVFDDAMDAVQTAIALTGEIERRNADVPLPRQVKFRMGIDQGEVAVSEDDYHGDALNIAARIQALARPGGLSVSGSVYRALDEPALRFRSIGRKALKNIPEQIEVYEFVDLPGDGSKPIEHESLSLESPTVAILPIHTEMVDDETVRRAAAVIRSDLVHRLSAVPELDVVDAHAEREVGGQGLSARYMLETGVHQLGDQVRVYATIFDVTTMNVVKSHRWTANAEAMFALSDRVADEVARDVEIELVVGEPAGLYAELDDPEAIEKVYLGWYHLRSDTREGWMRAVDLFGQVARSHPEQPYGFVLSGFANWVGASNGWPSDVGGTLRKAREQARAGLDLGDPTGMATAVEAAILMSEGKGEEALAVMDGLEVTRPTCDVTYGLEGSVRRYLGQWRQAVDLIDVAMRLTGIDKPWYPTVKACSLYVGGEAEQAASLAESVLEYKPNNLEALLVLAAAQSELGMTRRSKATSQLIKERFPATDVQQWLEETPFENHEIIERWKRDLVSAGVIEAAG
jgi:TolB-like protein